MNGYSSVGVSAGDRASAYRGTALVVTALRLEYQAVRAFLTDVVEEVHEAGTVYEHGVLGEGEDAWQVYVVEAGAGNNAAAVEAERAIQKYNPDIALFVGIAGGIKDVSLGDVVTADKIHAYESGRESKSGFQPRPDGRTSSYRLVQRARAESRRGDWKAWAQRYLGEQVAAETTVLVGPIAAGEKVVAATRSATYQFLRRQYSDALAVEMEGRGFLAATHANDVQALVVRGISDLIERKEAADAGGSQPRAARHAAAFALFLLTRLDPTDWDPARARARQPAPPPPADAAEPPASREDAAYDPGLRVHSASPVRQPSTPAFLVLRDAARERVTLECRAFELLGQPAPRERLVAISPYTHLNLHQEAIASFVSSSAIRPPAQMAVGSAQTRQLEHGTLWQGDGDRTVLTVGHDGSMAVRWRPSDDRRGATGSPSRGEDVGVFSTLESLYGAIRYATALARGAVAGRATDRWGFRLELHGLGAARLLWDDPRQLPQATIRTSPSTDRAEVGETFAVDTIRIAGNFALDASDAHLAGLLDRVALELAGRFNAEDQVRSIAIGDAIIKSYARLAL